MSLSAIRSTLLAGLGSLALFSAAPANAIVFTYSGTQWQTMDGQNFTFEFDEAGASTSDGTLTISGRTDLGGAGEYYHFDIEGLFGAMFVFPTLTAHHGTHDKSFSDTYIIPEETMKLIVADGEIEMMIDFNTKIAFDQSDEAYVSVNLTYVPEPATLALFGLGLAGLGFFRRRRTA